jgi:hypothetical protein
MLCLLVLQRLPQLWLQWHADDKRMCRLLHQVECRQPRFADYLAPLKVLGFLGRSRLQAAGSLSGLCQRDEPMRRATVA